MAAPKQRFRISPELIGVWKVAHDVRLVIPRGNLQALSKLLLSNWDKIMKLYKNESPFPVKITRDKFNLSPLTDFANACSTGPYQLTESAGQGKGRRPVTELALQVK